MNIISILSWMVLLFAEEAAKRSLIVTSLDELQRAVTKAEPGDVIVLADGVYTAKEDIVIVCNGAEGRPITITTENTGGAEITGQGGFRLAAPAKYVTIRGFKFTHHASHARTENGTSFCRWTQNIFETPGKGDYLTISGSDHAIDSNIFRNKNSLGKFIAIRGEGSQIAQRLWIHHNYFYNFANQGGANGAEALQFGLSGFSLSSSNSIVEHNLFERCHGENELISVKASSLTLRYNTIRDCPAQFTLRHGNRCEVYGNYFFNTPGLRIFGDDHIIHSNYFENCSIGINIGNGGGEVADGAKLTSHDRPDRVLIAFNTLVNNKRNFLQTPRKDGLGATVITIAHNIVIGGGPAAEISGPFKESVWKNNVLFDVVAGHIPTGGFALIDPMLARDSTGIFRLHVDSRVRNSVNDEFISIKVDMDGQARDSRLDAGADEISDSKRVARPLKQTDVGPL